MDHHPVMMRLALLCVLLAACMPARAESPTPAAAAPAVIGRARIIPADSTVSPVDSVSLPALAPVPCVLLSVDGEATYYASRFDGRRTASGRVFRNAEPIAAHRTFPFGTRIRVTNRRNGNAVELVVEDRGPHGAIARARSTIVDVSQSAARELDFIRQGRTPVTVDVLEWGGAPPKGSTAACG